MVADGQPSGRRPRFQVVNAFWKGNSVVLVERNGDKVKRRTVPAEYTCFVKADELGEDNERKLRGWHHIHSLVREGSWWRIRFHNWKVRRKVCARGGNFEKAGVTVYEADVHPVRRFLTDNDVVIQKPRRCYLDLETDPRVPIVRQIAGEARVLSWALVDDAGNKVYGLLEADTDEAEARLLSDLWDELFAYDQICAWNGDRFDFNVLPNRSAKFDINVEPRRWLWLDHMMAFKRLNMNVSGSGDEKESMALDRVAQGVLGRGKHDHNARDNWEVWESNPYKLIDYNVEDAVLMRDIEREKGYLDLHFAACEACSTFSDSRGTNPTTFVEGYMLKLGMAHDHHFPTLHGMQEGDKFEGAYVMEPTQTGLVKDVHVCDFSGMYPSIIVSWNMSPETIADFDLRDHGQAPSYALDRQSDENALVDVPPGHCVAPLTRKVFRNDVDGLLPLACKGLMKLRGVWKKKMNAAPAGSPEHKRAKSRAGGYKIVINSFYGVVGSLFSRFYVRDVAESVTQAGKWLILETIKAAEERGLCGMYCDTDSVFVVGGTDQEFQDFVDWCNVELYPKSLAELGVRECAVELGYEKKFSRLVMIRKKRYAAKYDHTERVQAKPDAPPEIKGLEYKRGDTLRLAREMQHRVIKMLLYDEVEQVEPYRLLLLEWRTRILEGELAVEDVRMSQNLSRRPEHYQRKAKKDGELAAPPPHVAVALVLAERGEDVDEGVRIEYVVKDASDSPMTAIPAAEYDGTNVDRYYLWENQIYPSTMRVLEAVFRGHKWRDYLRVRPSQGRVPRGDNLGQVLLF